MKRQRKTSGLISITGLAFALLTSPTPTHGNNNVRRTVDTGVVVGGVAATTGVILVSAPTIIGFFIAAVVAPAGEIAVASVDGAAGTLIDPPDLTNYAVRADSPLLVPPLPADTNVSDAFMLAASNYTYSASQVIQTYKNISDTVDRLAGARLVGTPTDVSNQQTWLGEFTQDLITRMTESKHLIRVFNARLAAESPELYNLSIPLSDMLAVKQQEAAGNFPTNEQALISFWELSPHETQIISAAFTSLSDSAIAQQGEMNFGKALQLIAGDSVTLSMTAGGSSFQICWPSDILASYQLQWTPSLSGVWSNFGPILQGNGTNICLSDTNVFNPGRFYRVVTTP